MKKILSLCVCIIVTALCVMCASAATYGGNCGAYSSNLIWEFDTDTNTLTISGTSKMASYASAEDVPWYSYGESIQNITIEDGVKSLCDRAFYSCTKVREVNIPESVTSIGKFAFLGCESLEKITVDKANTAYSSLNGILFNKDRTTIIQCPRNIDLTEYYVPYTVTTIGDWAFYNCTQFEKIFTHNNVTTVGSNAFKNCVSPTSLTLTDRGECGKDGSDVIWMYYTNNELVISGEGEMEDYPYEWVDAPYEDLWMPGDGYYVYTTPWNEHLSSIDSVVINEGVTYIGEAAFVPCENLIGVDLPNSLTFIGKEAFYRCLSLKSITIPDSVTIIGDWAFTYCASLESITIPDSVTIIGDSAFYLCESLESITIPDSVTIIGDSAFFDCTSLKSITIPDSVTIIGDEVFFGCKSLKSITIPDSVTTIDSNAFKYCNSLKDIYCYKGSRADSYFDNTNKYTKHYITDTGDADGDGEITVRDAALILQYRAYWDVEIDTVQADVTGDGKVNVRDAALILQYLTGWDVALK